MENKTEIKYTVKSVDFGEKIVEDEYTILVDETFENEWEIEDFLDGSPTIWKHVDESAFGFLLSWDILSFEVKSPCRLAAERVWSWYGPISENKKKRWEKRLKWRTVEYNQGWLDPLGKFIPLYGTGIHNEWASEYLKDLYGWRFLDFDGYAYQTLEDWGWIRILNWSENKIKLLNHKNNFKPTEQQRDTLFHFCHQFNLDYEKTLNNFNQ